MKGLKCPRCKNEELKGNENYCPICGLDLKDGTAQDIAILEPLEIRIDSKFVAKNLTNCDKV